MDNTVLAIVAHPDDAEFLCAGTLTLLKQKGWNVQMATMTAGDCGSVEYNRKEISEIRKAEASKAASLLGADYHCLESDDVFIMYDKPTIIKTIELIRKTQPRIVLTMSPDCYMVDHEVTSRIVQTACFAGGVVNIETKGIAPFHFIPYLYYGDAMEGKNKFGEKIKAGMVVDISSVIDVKVEMLKCHDSQRSWLKKQHGIDEYIHTMKGFSEKRGEEINVDFGEGFRQHLGHAFPQDNILEQELGDLVHNCNKYV